MYIKLLIVCSCTTSIHHLIFWHLHCEHFVKSSQQLACRIRLNGDHIPASYCMKSKLRNLSLWYRGNRIMSLWYRGNRIPQEYADKFVFVIQRKQTREIPKLKHCEHCWGPYLRATVHSNFTMFGETYGPSRDNIRRNGQSQWTPSYCASELWMITRMLKIVITWLQNVFNKTYKFHCYGRHNTKLRLCYGWKFVKEVAFQYRTANLCKCTYICRSMEPTLLLCL